MPNLLRTSDPDLARTVMVALQKGGTGKTTFSAAVAYEAARLGATVLVLDLDPNWGLTGEHLGYDPGPAQDLVVADLVTDGAVSCAAAAILEPPTAWQLRSDLPWEQGGPLVAGGALGVIPGYPTLQEAIETTMSKPAAEMRLRQSLREVARHFDLVLIDTGPRADRIAWLGMQAAATIVSPVIPEDGAAKGLSEQLEFIQGYTENWEGLPIRFAGAVCTKFDTRNRATHGTGLERMRELMAGWDTTEATARETIPGLTNSAGTLVVPDSPVGAVVWDEVIPQAAYVLHGQMSRLPIAYGLWPDPQQPPYRQAQIYARATAAVAPYSRAALRLLHLIDAPCLPRIAEALTTEQSDALWASQWGSSDPRYSSPTPTGITAPIATSSAHAPLTPLPASPASAVTEAYGQAPSSHDAPPSGERHGETPHTTQEMTA